MPIDVKTLCRDLNPATTSLLFGAGSSVPSGSPTSLQLVEALAERGKFSPGNLNLMEAAALVEDQLDRETMIQELRAQFRDPNPTGGLQNLPLYPWRNIYTTNYDELIEEAYRRKGVPLSAFASNFDFSLSASATSTKLFKLHGTISQDTSTGHKARMIVTEADYEVIEDFREAIFDTFKADLHNSNLLIIGHSLADDDIKDIVNRSIAISRKVMGGGKIYLLMYGQDVDRAKLHEAKGLKVCFSGIDEFFAELASITIPDAAIAGDGDTGSACQLLPRLAPVTLDVVHSTTEHAPNLAAMFNGWPATYADISKGLTFPRAVATSLVNYIEAENGSISIVLGASGVGKTTAIRQAISQLARKGLRCWEHLDDHSFDPKAWRQMARDLRKKEQYGVLLVDDAHHHIYQLNELVDSLASDDARNLSLILISSKNQWQPRVKTPTLHRFARIFELSQLIPSEIISLLDLLDANPEIQGLADRTFSSFSRQERERRLMVRCDRDMFVCLKNIFASEKFDDIVLREFADLGTNAQDVYRTVAAMETAGVRVHRQLIIRMLGIPTESINAVLNDLEDIVHEYTVDAREGIYGWKGRHPVITEIIARHKYDSPSDYDRLLNQVVDCLVPTYEIERRTIRELCNIDGLSRLSDRETQNALLSRMISKAPGERVPRHRLIRNFIDQRQFEDAETEVRLFENDFGIDGPVYRYKIVLLQGRALHTPGLLQEDRVALLKRALTRAENGVTRYVGNVAMMRAYGEVALDLYKKTKDIAPFENAIRAMKDSETRVGDPEITRAIAQFERRLANYDISRQ